MPDADRDYSLSFDPKNAGKKLPPLRTCKACFAVFSGSPAACPCCGEELEQAGGGRSVQEVQGDQVRAVALDQLRQKVLALNERLGERQEFYVAMLRKAEERGNKDGWAAYQFKNRYGTWPSKAMDPRRACLDCNRRSFSVEFEGACCSLCLAQKVGAQLTCKRCGRDYVADGHPRCPPCRRTLEEDAAARRAELHSGAPGGSAT
jgi:predicted amidophosphoribosyltransferase